MEQLIRTISKAYFRGIISEAEAREKLAECGLSAEQISKALGETV